MTVIMTNNLPNLNRWRLSSAFCLNDNLITALVASNINVALRNNWHLIILVIILMMLHRSWDIIELNIIGRPLIIDILDSSVGPYFIILLWIAFNWIFICRTCKREWKWKALKDSAKNEIRLPLTLMYDVSANLLYLA